MLCSTQLMANTTTDMVHEDVNDTLSVVTTKTTSTTSNRETNPKTENYLLTSVILDRCSEVCNGLNSFDHYRELPTLHHIVTLNTSCNLRATVFKSKLSLSARFL